MSQETKWQEVAHYYSKSGIFIQTDDKGIREMLGAQGTRGVMYATRAHALLSHWSQHKPILRHLDDITEDEDRECMEVHTRWVDEENWTDKESLKKVIWSLAKENKAFDQYSSHWLFSHGFDVVGLIESGQAIRKEKEL